MRLSILPLCLLLLGGAAPPVSIAPVAPDFAAGADEYRRIWAEDGARIVAALERTTGLAFPGAPIDIIVSGGSPMTAYDGRTIRLRATYSRRYKQATLVHELGHSLALTLGRRTGLDDHHLLYLFLYDVWTDLYGAEFADRMVSIERRIRGPSDYDAAWTWALGQSRAERQRRMRALVASNPPRTAEGRAPSSGSGE